MKGGGGGWGGQIDPTSTLLSQENLLSKKQALLGLKWVLL